jgi:hypothetical protein
MKIPKSNIRVWDIVYLYDALYDGALIKERPFLVIDRDVRAFSSISLLEISGQPKTGDDFPYNQSIIQSQRNGLSRASHAKCDMLYINCEHIMQRATVVKFGELEQDMYQSKINALMQKAQANGDFVFIDQSNNGMVLR